MEREGVSHISIPYRMTPPTSPLSPGGVGGSKDTLQGWTISHPVGGVIARQGSTPAAQQPIAHCIYAPIVHDLGTPISISLEMFGLF